MKALRHLSVFLEVAEELLVGLPLFVAPDYFFNADDGFVPFRPFHHTSLQSDHLDIATQISLAGAGASMLTILCARFFLSRSSAENAIIPRMKLISHLLLLPVLVNSAFFEYNDFIDRKIFLLFTNWKLFSILCNFFSIERVESKGRQVMNGQSLGAQVIFWYALPIALFLYIAPEIFQPESTFKSYSYYLKTPLEDNTFDAVEKFAIRFEGSQIIGFIPLFWDASKITSFSFKTGLTFMSFYIFVFMRGVTDHTGTANLEVWKGNFVLHLFVISLAWNLKRTKLESFISLKTYPHVDESREESKDGDPSILPDLLHIQ